MQLSGEPRTDRGATAGLSECVRPPPCADVQANATADINHGQKILVRLRPAHAPDTFYDEEDILHTMLHEVRLC